MFIHLKLKYKLYTFKILYLLKIKNSPDSIQSLKYAMHITCLRQAMTQPQTDA